MACGDGGVGLDGGGDPDTVPTFSPANFSDPLAINNPYWTLTPNTTSIIFEQAVAGPEIIVVEVLDETRIVAGVPTRVVRDRVFVDGLLVEDTHDWYAQDDDGNVWYMGEAVIDYVHDANDVLIETATDGSWEAGVGGARPGYQMLANPTVGQIYHQEYSRGIAEDAAEVIAVGAPVTLADGTQYAALQTRDFSTLEPTLQEYKYYASGIGTIKLSQVDGSDVGELLGVFDVGQPSPTFDVAKFSNPTEIDNPLQPLTPGATLNYESSEETIEYEVTNRTKVVAGVTTRVINDRVYDLDGVIVEDTDDWFAQDDAGNVWYMGEAVKNYNYDEDGNLIDITNEGSWEAGVDGAQPGVNMWAAPAVRTSYRQELYRGTAEDMAFVIRTDATIRLSDGTVYTGCLQTLDWVPLDPAAVEYKYWAPGIGLVYSTHVELPDEAVELAEVVP
ncbi:MAG: hypothetical protein WKG01_01055 [Kofleriaceae bacterium]